MHRMIQLTASHSLAGILFSGCASIEHGPSPAFSCAEKWVVLPISNFSEAPHAGQAAEKLVENVLRSRGLRELTAYPPGLEDSLAEFSSSQKQYDRSLDWARAQSARYGITGSITEWRYKSGVEGEPAVGMTLQVIDIETGKGIWSAGGAKAGWSGDALSGVAQKLIHNILSNASIACPG